jgi:DNA/RNA-binding domain of Phe-tRNA-synthetase-like protein
MNIHIELPGVKLGVVEASDVREPEADQELERLIAELCEQKRKEFTVESLAEAEPIREVRSMFRSWGMDPSKYRPSSEALLRRIVQGKDLYRVSTVVDIGNLGSVETGWPYGCYDRSRLHPPITLRQGRPGECYQGIGKRLWHLEGRPVLADLEGPFGSPISDSTRSMITPAVQNIVAVIYAPVTTREAGIELALERLSERLSGFAQARPAQMSICR